MLICTSSSLFPTLQDAQQDTAPCSFILLTWTGRQKDREIIRILASTPSWHLVLLMLAVKLVHLGDEDNSTVEHHSDVHATA